MDHRSKRLWIAGTSVNSVVAVALTLGLVHLAACASQDSAPPDATRGQEGDANEAAFTCAPDPTDPIPSGGTCPTIVTACGAANDTCLGADLRAALAASVIACDIYCGDVQVGFSAGCATTMVVQSLQKLGGGDAKDCLKTALFGARFDCVPTDGWKRVYLGSCTLP